MTLPDTQERNTVREAFEFWYSDEGTWPKAVEKDEKGRYALGGATAAWDAWKAAAKWQREQDALICDAKEAAFAKDCNYNAYWQGQANGAVQCAEAIRATPPQPGAAQ